MDTTYEKGGSAGSKGVNFQVDLLQVFLLNSLRKLENWRLSTENKKAGKFDDVILEMHDGNAVLLQAKFKENTKKKITLNQLLSVDSKNDDFSVPKYFLSFEEVKKTFPVKNVIICTNADVDKTALTFLKSQKVSSDSPLHYEHGNCSLYIFRDEILPTLKEHVENYYKNNKKGKNNHEAVVNDENLKVFLEKLQFYFNYPQENNLTAVTEELLFNLKPTGSLWDRASAQDVHSKIMNWFQQPKGQYLTKETAKAMFCEIRSNKYCQMLENYNVHFERNDFIFTNPERIFHVTVKGGCLLEMIKIHQILKEMKTKTLIASPDDDTDSQREIAEAFRLPSYVFLVMVKPKLTDQLIAKKLSDKLTATLKKYNYKKIILADLPNSKLIRQLDLDGKSYDTIKRSVMFQDLSKDNQEKLLKCKNIVLQGYDQSLKDLFSTQNVDYGKVISPELLERLIRDEKITVGAQLSDLPEDISRLYVDRSFEREIETRQGRIKIETFSENDIFNINEKLVLIADSAGTGKSTVLTKLAVTIKKNNPHLWVIRINLNDYTKILRDTLRRNKKEISIREMLDSKDSTKFRNQLEKFVFLVTAKVVLMIDGVDEVSPDFTGLILNLLNQCRKAPNFDMIFVTTRPHLTEELEAKLQVNPFILEPFSMQNQINFLSTFWKHSLKLNDADKEKCENYAAILVNEVCINLHEELGSYFTAVPLQLRMLAEVFQESYRTEGVVNWTGCKEFLANDEYRFPKLPQKMNIMEIYRMFIDKKRDLFVDKENPSGSAVVDQALNDIFNNCLSYHRALAVEVMLEERERGLFPCYQQGSNNMVTNLLTIGIMQKFDKDLNFIHKTFAEYFFAEILLEQLKRRNQNVEFQMFFVEEILSCPEFRVTRSFLDSFLRQIIDYLPSNIFENYQSLEQKTNFGKIFNCNLLHLLAEEGCVGILRLVLKCIDFKAIRNKEVHIMDLYKMYCTSDSNIFPGKTLNCLKYLVERGGVNIKDDIGRTPLHYAVQRLHIDMVKFLVEHGAGVNNADDEGRTALHIASNYRSPFYEEESKMTKRLRDFKKKKPTKQRAREIENMSLQRNFEIMTILIEQGADIKTTDKCGRNALFTAIYARNAPVATYLLRRILKTGRLRKHESVLIYMAARENGLKTCDRQMRPSLEEISCLTESDKEVEQLHVVPLRLCISKFNKPKYLNKL